MSLYRKHNQVYTETSRNIRLSLACEKALRGGEEPRMGGGGYSHKLPIRVCAAQRARDFEAPDLERGIHFRGVF